MKHFSFSCRMPVMKAWALGLLILSTLLLNAARADVTEQEWQERVASKYPAAAVLNSTFNKTFIQEYTERKKSAPEFFNNPKWPMFLADEVAAKLPATEQGHNYYVPRPPEKPSFLVSVFTTMLGTPIGICFSLGAIFVVPVSLWVVVRRKRLKRLLAESDAYMEQARKNQALPTVPSNRIFRSGESIFYSEAAKLYETITVMVHERDHRGRGKGISSSTTKTTNVQELAHIDSGTLTITDRRFIFDGTDTERRFELSEVDSINPSLDGLEVSSESLEKNMIFKVDNPFLLAEIIRMSCEMADSLELGEEEVVEDEEVSEDEEVIEDGEVAEEEIVEDEEVTEDEEVVEDQDVLEEGVVEEEELVESEENSEKKEARESEEMLEVRELLKKMRKQK